MDQRFSEELLTALSPLGVRASLSAMERLSARDDEVAETLRRQLEQLEYEARRAFEQYNEVDPRNRLVAGELERRWNAKLEEVKEAKARLTEIESSIRRHGRPWKKIETSTFTLRRSGVPGAYRTPANSTGRSESRCPSSPTWTSLLIQTS